MALTLESLGRCLEGVIPGMLTTAARDGTPNMIAVSYVHRVDDKHIALSRQFFRKTHANLAENPQAQAAVMDPQTMVTYRLNLRFAREELEGPLFDQFSARIDAIASMTGMKEVFGLKAVAIYEVLDVIEVPGVFDEPAMTTEATGLAAIDAMTQLRVLRRIADCVRSSDDAETLLESVLAILEETLGFEHAMILLLDETGERLYTLASRGYAESGIGAEVRVGDGIIGTVAKERRLLRMSSMMRARIYGRAVRTSVEGSDRDEIPLPGLPDAESQLAVPLLVKDELLGVLAVESRRQLSYGEREEAFLEVVAGHVALALREAMRANDAAPAAAGPSRRFTFYPEDDCVFVDGDYLVRNVPGRILWKLLRAHVDAGRVEFTNRELRLDPSLGLPTLRQNLESRLILLKKRLAERCPEIVLVPTGRGRFRLDVACALDLETSAKT